MSKQIKCTKYNSTGIMAEETCAKRYKRANEEIDQYGDTEYYQCKECSDGKKNYDKHFENAPELPPVKRGKFKTLKRRKKGDSPYSCKYAKSLTPEQFKEKTQVSSERIPRRQKASVNSQGNIGTKRGSDPEPEPDVPDKIVLILNAYAGYLADLVLAGKYDDALRKIKLLYKEIDAHEIEAASRIYVCEARRILDDVRSHHG